MKEYAAEEKSEPNQGVNDHYGEDVYDNARKLNLQLAIKGPAVLYALGKVTEQVDADSTIVTAVGGMVVGAFGFFGNRYYRNRGDQSAYSYMGQIVGGVQFTAGFLLLAAAAYEVYSNEADPTPLLNVIKMAGVALTLTESALVLVNSYLYGDGASNAVATKAKSS